MRQNRVLGITGKMGSGKSTISSILAQSYGFKVIDVDKEYHTLLEENEELKKKLTDVFGEEILVSGRIDRNRLRALVTADKSRFDVLNKITHEFIFERVSYLVLEVFKEYPTVIDAALLFEIGLNKLCSVVWFVEAEENVLVERIIKRNGWSEKEIKSFLERQKVLESHKKLANRVIMNNFDIEELKSVIKKYLKEDGLI
ncbi:dephospho-CoA kinase [Caldicellulosiruptor hydrothermalis 108]|uniref:Dephospho-CoA kinase n=1 Tax=Caldicellulosiruptor hydrothermalis (strain DSM 18901 / VKM B-2411 / 108) TaxID=632292 RepID=E4QA43_CALH1|nr:dephospho-CoA kinase [Caldicellulosiruptor hydrothermalis]ADQ07015.1 dephospho-CoA kinase [Caldicellulosiruptor hydrothermalis 108]